MSLLPCSVCKQRKPGKLASAYWAWFDSEGNRQAWKARYCLADAAEELGQLLRSSSGGEDNESLFSCASCGIDTTEDQEPVYCTLFLPGQEQTEHSIPLCGACAASFRTRIMSTAMRLENRDVLASRASQNDAWAALGITAR